MPVNARERWSPLNHDAKFVNTNFPAPLDTNIGTDKKKVIYTGMWQVKFDWTTLQSVLLQKIHCSHCPEREIETEEAKNTFSAWSLCKQFLFQKEQKSLKIKLNANKLQKKYSVSLSKIKKCRVLASELTGQPDILGIRKVQMMQVFALPELSAEKPQATSLFCSKFLNNF